MGSRFGEETRLPFHVEAPAAYRPSSISSPRRSSSFSSSRTRSDRAALPPQDVDDRTPIETPSLINLNRWSRSTTSSSHTHNRSNSSRRMSFGGAPSSYLDSPPRKLQRKAASPSQIKITRDPIDSSSITLPPINTLPSLQTSLNTGLSPLSVDADSSPSTAQILSAAARSVDYFGKVWDDASLAPKDFSQKRSPSSSKPTNLGPSPVLVPGIGADYGAPRRTADREEQRPRSRSRGHSRHRSQNANGSAGTQSSNRSSKQPSQKAMLSKALQKANTAVLLDNAQNFEGAMQAYSEACTLLQQVMVRSSGDEDRRKLEAIRNTYTSRISELEKIAPQSQSDTKALPARPTSGAYQDHQYNSPIDDENPSFYETANMKRYANEHSYVPQSLQSRSIPPSQVPQRRESLLPSNMDSLQSRNPLEQYQARTYSRSPVKERSAETNRNLAPPMDSQYMPPPLSPRRPLSPANNGSPRSVHRRNGSSDMPPLAFAGGSTSRGHARAGSNESMSWLDTIDESGGSAASSVHSRTSSLGVRRKRIRAPSGATEAEFDAALDAAVEAAYDDGLEPVETPEPILYNYDDDDEVVANVRRRVELAKERVRQSEREVAVQAAHEKERKRMQEQKQRVHDNVEDDYVANESEEEERMLEEMTRGYIMDDFEFGLQSKSALPRESDSSGFSGRTWHSSIGSNPTTAGTVLSAVSESYSIPQLPLTQFKGLNLSSAPTQALPPPPNSAGPPPLSSTSQSVRSRRLSGQNAKQLKIETAANVPMGNTAPTTQPAQIPQSRLSTTSPTQPKTASFTQPRQSSTVAPPKSAMLQSSFQASSSFPNTSPSDNPNLTQTLTNDSDGPPRSGSPGRAQSRSGLRKNFSSSSLKNIKGRNLSVVSTNDEISDASPNTPMSSQFNSRDANSRIPTMPTLPTPIAAAFKDRLNGIPTGGMFLFNSDFHSPNSPSSPESLSSETPIPLEPCPTEYLLRPFWLMRALYQTITHPKGGYISTKLFVPRDVWQVKGVKIKNIEDKIANCDFLTAALLKLAQVDTFDADAVLEEMQSLEGVLEQVQVTLTKRLGNDVGVQGTGGFFKDAPNATETDTSTVNSKSASVSSKASSFSWKRLRSKNSAVNLATAYSSKTSVDGPKEGLTIATLPMTTSSVSKVRFAKHDVNSILFSGPNATYMSALARLFDAAQVIDQIARQVEDPGLRHADKTQVGLELCTRHAAEFFGFYICRFVLTDVGMLLDKFIKRGSEWVLV